MTTQYKKAWKYLIESRRYIYLATILYIIFFMIGTFQPNLYSEEIRGIMQDDEEMSSLDIFIHNLKIDTIKLITGIAYGIIPIGILIINGYVIGFMMAETTLLSNPFFVLSFIIVAILELPLSFISAGLGLKLGMFIFKKEKIKYIKEITINNLRILILIICPILFISAIIENYLIKTII